MKLSDWLPILQHPEVGSRICEAAGCRVSSGVDLDGALAVWLWWDYEQDSGLDELTVAESAALAFGTLAVLQREHRATLIAENDRWFVLTSKDGSAYCPAVMRQDTPDAAVLAAAKRVWLEGDNDG